MTSLVPRPQGAYVGSGSFTLREETSIACASPLAPAAHRLRDQLSRATGLPFNVFSSDDPRPAQDSIIVLEQDTNLADEGYELTVTEDAVRLRAATARGAHWAVQTLLQMLPSAVYRQATVGETRWEVPAAEIQDTPRFSWRGVMLDVTRHFLPPREIRRMIDLLALHKLNTLHLHLSDDQGWRVEIKRYPRLTEVGGWRRESQLGAGPDAVGDGRPHGGYYTQDDIREIVAYAAARGIDVVPELELPGHVQAALAAYPELGVTTDPLQPWTRWGINTNILNAEESTVEFLQHVFDEVVELFPSAFIGVGGDECRKDQWRADPRTQERMRELGVPDEEALQSWFITRMDTHLRAHGRRLLGWDEILEGGLAPGATVLSWRGQTGALAAARAGHDVVSCPEDTVYLDYRQSDSPAEPIPVGIVTTVEEVYAFNPVPAELTPDEARHVLGGQGNIWTEHMDSSRTIDYYAFPRLAALAEALWTGGERDYREFASRLEQHLDRLEASGVEYRRSSGPLPWQQRPGVPGRPSTKEERAALVAELTANIASS